MSLSWNEFWTVLHGLVFGTVYLLAFTGGFEAFWSLGKETMTDSMLINKVKRLKWGTWTMAIMSWITVITGTYIVYIWYRAKIPTSPRSLLLANPDTALWHTFGMEWKEHIAWFAPILATVVAIIVTHYGIELAKNHNIRKYIFILFCLSFFAAGVAGLFGAFINKVAPVL